MSYKPTYYLLDYGNIKCNVLMLMYFFNVQLLLLLTVYTYIYVCIPANTHISSVSSYVCFLAAYFALLRGYMVFNKEKALDFISQDNFYMYVYVHMYVCMLPK